MSSESPKPPSNGKPWSLGADKKTGFSSDREKSVRRYLTESGNQTRNYESFRSQAAQLRSN